MQILNVFQISHLLTSGYQNAVHDTALSVAKRASFNQGQNKQVLEINFILTPA